MQNPEIEQRENQEGSKPYFLSEPLTSTQSSLTIDQLKRRALETRIAAQREQRVADRAYERRTGYRSPRQS